MVSSVGSMLGGTTLTESVHSPLMEPIQADWLLLEDGTAVIEMAAASGLTLLSDAQKNPMNTTTYGTGELILAALQKGVKKIIIGIGGSATNDCGLGMAAALGVRFYDQNGELLSPIGKNMIRVEKIDLSDCVLAEHPETEIFVACDVTNPLYGKTGAAYVYAPQKGASPQEVEALDQGLRHMAKLLEKQFGLDCTLPGTGAAGGLGAGLMAFAGGKLRPGIELILDLAQFDRLIADADYIFTGEGKTDGQTLCGKVPMGVGLRAKKAGVPAICVSGCVEPDAESLYEQGISALFSIANGPITLEQSIQNAAALIHSSVLSAVHLIAAIRK